MRTWRWFPNQTKVENLPMALGTNELILGVGGKGRGVQRNLKDLTSRLGCKVRWRAERYGASPMQYDHDVADSGCVFGLMGREDD